MERELLILGLLRGQEMHGYQLNDMLARVSKYVGLKRSTIYFLLDKMTGNGWMTFTEEQEGNRPARRVYQITPEGEAAFQKLLRDNLSQHHPTQFIGDIGLAFADALSPDELRALLLKRQTAVQGELRALQKTTPGHPAGGLQWILQHQVRHLQTELDWIDDFIGHLPGGDDHA